ncbi:MAG: complex I NDUFA9 subunit family protein [Pseudomonadota bacterium]|nr:complex I NDUFA9 subunit family protein [Pseudomonadota bacterium]
MIKAIAILGGTGFVGRHLANRLTKARYPLKVLTRRRERHRDLLVIPTLDLVEADVHDPAVLQRELRGCDAVVNLIGILNERGDDGSGFREAHVELARKLIAACRANEIPRLLHMSALNADAQAGPSHYQRTKGEAEDLVHAAAEDFRVTSFRPSVIFGPDDAFFNRFAGLLRLAPLVFPLACPNARFAPVYVGDVVEAMALSLTDPATYGRRYDLCGPKAYTLAELVAYTAQCLKLRRYVLPLNARLSLLQAQILEHVPGKPLSLDNHRSLQIDSVCGGENGLLSLGITPTAVESVVPGYLTERGQRGLYRKLRGLARRK